MGNQLTISGAAASVNLQDVSTNLNLIAPLGGAKRGRLFTSLHCKNNTNGNEIVVKIFVEKQGDKVQAQILAKHQEALILTDQVIRAYYKKHYFVPCNVLYYSIMERPKTGTGYCMLQRPFIHYSLAERLQMRPFWEPCQRLFACYQLLQALYQLHDCCGTSHGDLKPENVLVTSCGWLYITDICPFKPARLESFNPANFEYFYDTAENRNCCCAPEKFVDDEVDMNATVKSATTNELFSFSSDHLPAPCVHKMSSDVFSAACVMVFILTDEPLFKLSGALEFRQKTMEMRQHFLEKELSKRRVSPAMIEVIKAIMCCGNDIDRPTAKEILIKFTPSAFPPVFGMLFNNVMPVLMTKPPDAQTLFLWSRVEDIMKSADRGAVDMAFARSIGEPDIRGVFDNVGRNVSTNRHDYVSYSSSRTITYTAYPETPISYEARSIVVSLVMPLITSIISFVRTSDSRCRLIITIQRWVEFASEYTCREVMLPWVRQMASSRRAGAVPRACAVRTILFILQTLPSLPILEKYLFEDYVLGVIEGILKESGVIPPSFGEMQPLIVLLTEIAAILPLLLCEGIRFLTQRQKYYWEAMKAARQGNKHISKSDDVDDHVLISSNSISSSVIHSEIPQDNSAVASVIYASPQKLLAQSSYDEELRDIRERGWECVKMLLGTGHSGIQVLVLQQLPTLCYVLGQERVSIDLMPQLTTFLSIPVVEVKAEMLRRTSFLAKFLRCGGGGNDALVSLLVMALEDGLKQKDVSCVLNALRSIKQISVGGTLPVNMVMQLTNASLRHLLSTNEWVKDEACHLVQAVARIYSSSDVILHLLKPMRSILTEPAPLASLCEYRHLIRLVPPKGMDVSCFKKRRYSRKSSLGPYSDTISCADFYTYVRNPRVILYGAIVPSRTVEDLSQSAHVDIYSPTMANLYLSRTNLETLSETKGNTTQSGVSPQVSNIALQKALVNYLDYDVIIAGELSTHNYCNDNVSPVGVGSAHIQNSSDILSESPVQTRVNGTWRMSEFLPTVRQLKRIYRRRKQVAPYRLDIAVPHLQGNPSNATDRNRQVSTDINSRHLSTVKSSELKNLSQSFVDNRRETIATILSVSDDSQIFSEWNIQMAASLETNSVLGNAFATPATGHLSVPSSTNLTTGDRGAIIRPYAAPLTEYIPNRNNTSITCMAAAGSLLVTGGHKGIVHLWDLDYSTDFGHSYCISGGARVSTVANLVPHTVQGLFTNQGTPFTESTTSSLSLPSVTFVEFIHSTASGSPIAIGASDGILRLVDPQSEILLTQYDYNAIQHNTFPNVNMQSNNPLSCCAKFSSNYMIIGCGDGTIRALDWRVNQPTVWKAHLKNGYGYVSALMSLYNTPQGVFGGGGGDPTMVTNTTSPLGEAYGALVGSSEGFLTFFDLRFQIQVFAIDCCAPRTNVKDAACVTSICADPMVTKSANSKVIPVAPAAVVALGNGDISRFDLGTRLRTLKLIVGDYAATSSSYTMPTESIETSYGTYRPKTNPLVAQYLPHSNQQHMNATRVLLQPPRSPLVLSAGDDCRVRIWDMGTMSNSRTMVREDNSTSSSTGTTAYGALRRRGSVVTWANYSEMTMSNYYSSYVYSEEEQSLREVCSPLNGGYISLPPPPIHSDGGITALCLATAQGQQHVVTASAGGSVKVWRNSTSARNPNVAK